MKTLPPREIEERELNYQRTMVLTSFRFEGFHESMQKGFAGTFDRLDEYLAMD
jgi:hypothetical protein